jgi:hypothetical protein
MQRMTWTYDLIFDNVAAAFGNDTKMVVLVALTNGLTSTRTITLKQQPNPFERDGDTPWLSTDLRVFKLRTGDGKFGVPSMGNTIAEASDFIQQVIDNLNFGNTGGQSFENDLAQDGPLSEVELSQEEDGHPVWNFAVARVHYRAVTTAATNVRVFFRLFQAATTTTDYQPASTYLRGGQNGVVIPLVGIVNNEIVTIPCFAAPRVDTTITSLDAQTDPKNVQTFTPDGSGKEIIRYFGCWLDINQTTPAFPINASSPHGPFNTPDVLPIQKLIRSQHQCLVAEIAFDSDPIDVGDTPANSDKLAQHNLSIVGSDNPGAIASHRIPQTFDIRPTSTTLAPDGSPDELMIDWSKVPLGSTASVYLPGVAADVVLKMADELYTDHPWERADDNTVQCRTGGIAYLPVPLGIGSNYAGLLTVDLPSTVRKGQEFKVVIRQVTDVIVAPPPRIALARSAPLTSDAPQGSIGGRHILGTFQITIPVTTKNLLLGPEERLLSVLRWIAESIPVTNRWYPIFVRYLGQIGDRVTALGGDPAHILPSPKGDDGGRHRLHEEKLRAFTGKVAGLIFDRFGDFDGFLLNTEDGERKFFSREQDIEKLAGRAWRERLRITVWTEREEPHRLESIVVREPPAPFCA